MTMQPQEVLLSALDYAAAHKGTKYAMGADDDNASDCSAFLWRALHDRKHDRNTDWIAGDALHACTKFHAVDVPFPGCVAVYGSRWEHVEGQPAKRHAGHVGIVVDVAKKLVVDCSSSQNGIRVHRQRVLFDGPSDGRKVIFCAFVG